ncbi:endonuclease/exonuclease/phosphatase family protein [Pimelobacter sp. 30-1]|uniref:endonuclease/exonuclease/phosphatase family protein n=1 Tax=Pimelobacter sp. 30-1 TaxID=2004991 RepID=UPI001C044A72|nr:endonuclease/exonuclease/phosphatase family protein [Pimelobacter sp. 30-1]MBU2698079.1 endonuclease [Pimelobacter sp. 30-1]
MRRTPAVLAALAALTALTTPAGASPPPPAPDRHPTVRFATFNASLNRGAEGQLVADLATPGNVQAANVAETIQRARPDVVLINEFDYAPGAADLFRDNYLEVGQRGASPITYPYAYVAPVNTGVPSGFDLNNDGQVGGGDDAFGFGLFPGQYGMVVYSRYPIDTARVRTFQHFLWKDMPGSLLPRDWYSGAEQAVLRLSSKSHWDVPIRIGRRTVHLLAAHPTPPTFDGPEDRNGKRNHDEIRFWADYVAGPARGRYIYDDAGRRGGLRPGSSFVIAGDLNADPYDGDSVDHAARQLLDHPRIATRVVPTSAGAPEAAALQGGANLDHRGDPARDTADFADGAPGNLRVDYVLPSRRLHPVRGGVFWPVAADPLARLTGVYPFPTSDHRLVWLDLRR